MALSHHLAPWVGEGVRHRGRQYFQNRVVDILHGDARQVQAEVRGTELYYVDLHCGRRALRVWCSCPYYEDHYHACKHIWATILQADAGGFLGDCRKGGRARIQVQPPTAVPDWVRFVSEGNGTTNGAYPPSTNSWISRANSRGRTETRGRTPPAS